MNLKGPTSKPILGDYPWPQLCISSGKKATAKIFNTILITGLIASNRIKKTVRLLDSGELKESFLIGLFVKIRVLRIVRCLYS